MSNHHESSTAKSPLIRSSRTERKIKIEIMNDLNVHGGGLNVEKSEG